MRRVLNPIPQTVIDGRRIPNSAAVRTDNLVFVKGIIGQVPSTGELASEEIIGQTREAIDTIRLVLEAGGSSLKEVAMVTVQLTRREDFADFNDVYAEYFGDDPPARTVMVAGILRPGALVEMTVVGTVAG